MVVTESNGTPGLASCHTSVPQHTIREPLSLIRQRLYHLRSDCVLLVALFDFLKKPV